ncbi:MAG: hypothetical protein CMG62_11500 [Candidatus Marinimicrobia bacterium]|nr:hypothetical protein [Candidatus Neomarinimicrobiota bacterium]|tara:strand:+ start:2083 stop:2562 length:480 start_codon:yes stop_codon:yes gene_type:complete
MKFFVVIYVIILNINFLYSQVSLSINAIPRKVDVFLDGENIGKTPLRDIIIEPGPHKFDLKKRGYAPLTHSVIINPAESVQMDYYLNPIYLIKFFTEEDGLSFELNDNHKWSENKIKLKIEAGEHFLRVYQNNKIIDEQTFVVDEPKLIQYIIKKKISS